MADRTPTCRYCNEPTKAVTGREIYPHRPDLFAKPFYACMPCGAWVGCHPGTTKPLGRVANAELRRLKMAAHAAFDPIWKSGTMKRAAAYSWLSEATGIPAGICHVGMMSEDECRKVVAVCDARKALGGGDGRG